MQFIKLGRVYRYDQAIRGFVDIVQSILMNIFGESVRYIVVILCCKPHGCANYMYFRDTDKLQ